MNLRKNFVCMMVGCTGMLMGCAQKEVPASRYDAMPEPPQKILITTGDLNQRYVILGGVTCEIRGISAYNTEQQNEEYLNDACAKEAYSRYGIYANAIINMTYHESLGDGFLTSIASAYGARFGNIRAKGVAVQLP